MDQEIKYNNSFFHNFKPHVDPYTQVTVEDYRQYLHRKAQKASFNFQHRTVDNRNSIPQHPQADYSVNCEIIANNPDYVSKTDFHIPNNPELKCHAAVRSKSTFENQWGQTLLTTDYVPIKTHFNNQHPIRHSIPHRGPGTQNLSNAGSEGAYVRVSGIISQLSFELLDISLPRWLPIFLDFFFYIDHQINKFNNETIDFKILKKNVTTYVQTMCKVLDNLDKKKLDQLQKLELAKQASKALETKLNLSVKSVTNYRAKCELEGDHGLMFLSAINMFSCLNAEHNKPFIDNLISTFIELYVATATESMSYAKVSQAAPYLRGDFSSSLDSLCKIRGESSLNRIKKDFILPLLSNKQPVFIDQDIRPSHIEDTMYIFLNGVVRPTYECLIFYSVNINMFTLPCLNPNDIKAHVFTNLNKADRSNMKRSTITQLDQLPKQMIEFKEPKLNGFQYQLTYKNDQKIFTTVARYPQAPQLLFKSDTGYDYDMLVEVASGPTGIFEIRIIAVYELGGVVPNNPENFHFLRRMRNFVKFKINNTVQWPYNKSDGLIITYVDGRQNYIRKNPTIDLFYDTIAEVPKIMCKQFIDGLATYTCNDWASALIVNHLHYKTKSYKENLKNITIAADTDNKFMNYALPEDGLNLSTEQHGLLDDPGPIYPRIQNCYNIPISYTDIDFGRLHKTENVTIKEVQDLNQTFLDVVKTDQFNTDLNTTAPKTFNSFYS